MKDMTLINVIFDKSGSMGAIAAEAVGMYNGFLEDQQNLPGYAELSLIQFDDRYEECFTRRAIKDCLPLVNGDSYRPRGLTAMYDAVGRTINKIGDQLENLPEAERPAKVLFIVITDGHENASHEYTGPVVKEMIDHQKREYSWDFIFLAAGISAFNEGSKIGMPAGKCATFSKTAQGMAAAGDTMRGYTTAYRATGDLAAVVDNHDTEQ